MKVFVRCVQSKMYFTEAGDWTEKKWEGHDFQTTLHVLDDPKLRVLNQDLEMVFSFGEAQFDVIIPIERGQQHHPGLGKRPKGAGHAIRWHHRVKAL